MSSDWDKVFFFGDISFQHKEYAERAKKYENQDPKADKRGTVKFAPPSTKHENLSHIQRPAVFHASLRGLTVPWDIILKTIDENDESGLLHQMWKHINIAIAIYTGGSISSSASHVYDFAEKFSCLL